MELRNLVQLQQPWQTHLPVCHKTRTASSHDSRTSKTMQPAHGEVKHASAFYHLDLIPSNLENWLRYRWIKMLHHFAPHFVNALELKKPRETHKKAGGCPCFTKFQKGLADFWLSEFQFASGRWECHHHPMLMRFQIQALVCSIPQGALKVGEKNENKGHIKTS